MKRADYTEFVHITKSQKFEYELQQNEEKTFVFLLTPTDPIDVEISAYIPYQGSDAQIIGLIIPNGSGAVHLKTNQIHTGIGSKSRCRIRSLLLSDCFVSYTGSVYISEHAENSDAFQQHDAMLLSKKARLQTRPILEILNQSVSCKHGVSIQTIPQDALWYAQTRGVDEEEFQYLYMRGFMASMLSRIPDRNIEREVYNQINKYLHTL